MPQRQFMLQRGQKVTQIVESAGSVISGGNSDAVLVNFDFTSMTRGEAVMVLREIQERILEGSWPPA